VGWMTRCRGSCQHGCLLGAAQALARTDPPTSSSIAEEKRLCSLLLSTAGARFPTLAADGVLLDQQFRAICQVASRRARAMSVRTPTPVPPGAT
jgi:hypothetical protein